MIELEEPLTNCGCPYCDEARENNSQKSTAQQDISKTKTPDLHVKSTAQNG